MARADVAAGPMTVIRVALVDDQEMIRAGLRLLVDHTDGMTVVGEAADGLAAIELVERSRPDVVVMDPPRSGSDPVFLDSLALLAPKRVVYISCEPTTLARDVTYLCARGYRMQRAVPVDMFPATEHVECVVLIERK